MPSRIACRRSAAMPGSTKKKGRCDTGPFSFPLAEGSHRQTQQPVNPGEEEQPHHVDEMPVPGGGLEADVLVGLELIGGGAEAADDQKHRADEHMEAMEAGGEEKGRRIDAVGEVE